jgi:hypothetical protein
MFQPFALLALMQGAPAHAAGFQAKTMRDPLPAREVERNLVIGKGWLELELSNEIKVAEGFWDEEGKEQDFENARWTYTTQRATVRYGLARRAELFWSLPTHYVQLSNPTLGTDTQQFGWGDPSFGYIHELFRSTAPTTSVIAKVFYKAPFADESPGNYIGGADSFTNVVMTTGTPDLGGAVTGKRQIGPFAVTGGMDYVHRFPKSVQYLIETEYHQFQARIKPGDLVHFDMDVMLQLGPLALHNAWRLTMRQETLIGTASPGLFADKNLEPIEGSDGTAVDMTSGLLVNITRGVDFTLDITLPLQGEDLQFFPIEDLHPTRGTTYRTGIELRY